MKIFFSYSPEDKTRFEDFERSLAVLKAVESLTFTHTQMALAHENSKKVADTALLQADLIFVLMSDDYFSTESCMAELKRATEWHRQQKKIMLCLLLRPCLWDMTELQDFKILPDNEKPISTWENIDEAYRNVALSFKNIIDKYKADADYRPINVENEVEPQSILQSKNQLVNYPRIQIPLFGRKNELQKFGRFFASNSSKKSRIISIEGLGGIGKRPFVAACIEKYIENKNRIVWLDIDSHTSFNDFVEQAGYGFLLENNKNNRSKYVALKTHLEAEKKILFWNSFQALQDSEFYDFLHAIADTLEHLQIIIISRFKPKFEVAFASIQLNDLKQEEAMQYIQYLQQMDCDYMDIPTTELQKLSVYTYGHPLAMQLGMELLSYGETAESVLESLKNHEHLYDNLLTSIFSHFKTKAESKELLLQLSVFEQKVTYEAIESIASSHHVKSILHQLIYKNILQITRSEAGTLYELQPLVRHFCYALLEDKKLIHTRAAAYFLQKREKLPNIAVEKQIFYHLEKSEQFDKIGNTIKLFGEALIGRGQHSFLEEMLEIVKDKDFDIGFYQLLQGKIYNAKGNWKEAYQCFLKACEVSKNSEVMVEAYLMAGSILNKQGEKEKALKYYELVDNYLAKRNNDNLKALLLFNKSVLYRSIGNLEKATFFYIEGMQVCEKLEDKTTQISLLQNMGIILEQQGDLKNAMLKYELALKKSKIIKDDNLIGKVLNSIGSIYYRKNNLAKALLFFEESLEAKKKAGDMMAISTTKLNIGTIQLASGKNKKALTVFKESVIINRALGNKKALSNALYQIGEIYCQQGKIEDALKNYQKALRIKQKFQDKRGIAIVYHNMSAAIFDLQKNKLEIALQYNFNALLGFYQLGSKYLIESINIYKNITKDLEIERVVEVEQKFMKTLDKKTMNDFYSLKQKKLNDGELSKKLNTII